MNIVEYLIFGKVNNLCNEIFRGIVDFYNVEFYIRPRSFPTFLFASKLSISSFRSPRVTFTNVQLRLPTIGYQ